MKIEDVQRAIDSLEEQLQKPFAVIMSPKNYEALMNTIKQERLIVQGVPNKASPSIGKESLVLFGMLIKAHEYFPDDSFLCVTKDGYDKIKGEAISNLLNMKSETWEKRVARIKRLFSEFYGEQNFTKLKEINMQEITKDDSTGEIHVEDTIEDLVPFIKAALAKPDVKYIKVFGGGIGPEKFRAEEEKKNILDEIADQK